MMAIFGEPEAPYTDPETGGWVCDTGGPEGPTGPPNGESSLESQCGCNGDNPKGCQQSGHLHHAPSCRCGTYESRDAATEKAFLDGLKEAGVPVHHTPVHKETPEEFWDDQKYLGNA